MPSSRSLVLEALERWRRGTEFADKIVADILVRTALDSSDRAFVLELFYGVLRNLSLLDFWIAKLRSEPVDSVARDILRLGLYQVLLIETAAHAAVFETVELARSGVRPLINAILRRALREKAALLKAAKDQPQSIRFSIPEFLIEKWGCQFDAAEVKKLCQWNNRAAPVYARINLLKTTVPEFLLRYPGTALVPKTNNFITLREPGAALRAGDCYIQDLSTALACETLRPGPGETVLDACSAPGGKAAYLAEIMQNKGTLVATDQDETRLKRLRDNFVRLGITNTRAVGCDWSDEKSIQGTALKAQSFDKILLDAPCTNTGVMRRRVDLRWRLRPEDFVRMQRLQLAILQGLVPMLKPGGSLVYSTCSLEEEENEQVIKAFLREKPNFRLTKSERRLPFRDGVDGAFVARLECM
jgi:16S rRNA (cytosine967-C5)-methyltransferase